jgi:hypothetical protein
MSHEKSPTAKFFEAVLVGTVEAIARAGSKAVESLAGDAKKALKNEAFKAELIEKGIEAWRLSHVGEIDDLPGSLQDEKPQRRAS